MGMDQLAAVPREIAEIPDRVVLYRCARQTLLRAWRTSVSPTAVQRRGRASIPQCRLIFVGRGAESCMGDSTENSRTIFRRSGEPWLMSYCLSTPKCRKSCRRHAFVEGPKIARIQRSNSGRIAWK